MHDLERELKKLIQENPTAFEFLYSGSTDGIWFWDPEKSGEKWISPQFWKALGYDPEEKTSVAAQWQDLVYPEDLPIWRDNIRKCCADPKRPYDQVVRCKHKDGSTVWLQGKGVAVRKDSGHRTRMIVTFRDITEGKNTEQSLTQAKGRLESLWNIAKLAGADIKTICDHVLSEVQQITQSRYAFYGFLDDAQSKMMLHSWSDETMEACRATDEVLHFPIDEAGIWADAVRSKKIITVNDFASRQAERKRTPDGHVSLSRLMAVPLIKGDKVVSIVGVANKKDDYTEEDGKQVEAFLGNVQTLIDREMATQELVKSERKFSGVFHHAPLMMVISDLKMENIIDVNQLVLSVFGYQRGEIIGKALAALNLITPEERTRLVETVKTDGHVQEREIVAYSKDGRPIPCVYSGILLEVEGEPHVISIFRDISEQKEAEKRLIDSERNYREIFNAVNDVLMIHDLKTGVIIDANSKVTELYGYEPGELRGMTVECLSSGDGPFTILEASDNIRKAIEEGPQLFEWMARHRSGETFWVEVNLKSTTIGGVDCMLAVIRDIRQRKANDLELNAYRTHLEEMVDQRTAEIKAINTELETFTYSVSHDLKAPLRGIDGYSRLLLEDYGDKFDEDGLAFLGNIRRSAEQMNHLIEDLLAYSRMELRELNPAQFNVRHLIDELLFEREREINARSARVTIDIAHDHMVGDRESIRQILGNFIDNAIKYTRDEAAPKIEITVSETDNIRRFSVRDNGIGFDPKYQDRIFGIFQRLHRSEDFPGTGVGLALVKKAASRMKGKTWAESMPGQGATFYLEIPELLTDEAYAKGALNGEQ